MNNPLVIVITVFWFTAMVGSIFTRNSDPFMFALIATIIVGFGYGLAHH